MRIAILGAGMVGRTIAAELCVKHTVHSFDINKTNLSLLNKYSNIPTVCADLSDYEKFGAMLSGFDMVVSAVPGFMGYKTLEALIRLQINVADISFFPEDALSLHNLALENNVTAIVDCGVAPGMSNLILGYYNSKMKITDFECMVGGLPKQRIKPFEYKAPFSPADVIEEYTRPARYMENGHVITRPALSDPELIYFENIGTLESFNTDGLRSILSTMAHIPDMKEKTLRYPGHIDIIRSLQMAGFFSDETINVKGIAIRPLDVTSSILMEQWKLSPNEPEFTVMKIVIKGSQDGIPKTVEYLLNDEFDPISGMSSMSRTTGYACAAFSEIINSGLFNQKGVFPPELIGGKEGCFDFIMNYLKEKGINYDKTES